MKYYNYTLQTFQRIEKSYMIFVMQRDLYKIVDYNVHRITRFQITTKYFGNMIRDEYFIIDSLQKYSYLLIMAISNFNLSKGEVVFMDYGGGHGMLALLAKTIGLGMILMIFMKYRAGMQNIGLDLTYKPIITFQVILMT